MDTHGGLAEIRAQLADAEKSLSEIFRNKVERLSTGEVKEKFKHFVDTEVFKIEQEIRHCVKTIDSPVFVGLLGRYSHGKTALVNSLFALDSEYCLVEGEGVVTSKITRVEFSEDLVRPKCFECYRNGEQSSIDIATLQASVSGKVAEDNSIVDYYFMKLPSAKPFAQVFERKLINLIDMPGLGGPYFKDTEKTKKYIEHLDMLLVVLKISEIDQASRVIDPYIDGMINKNIPMIPVITFFDKWRESSKFTDCTSDEDAIEKARKEIKACMPSLSRHMTRVIAVSAKNGFQIENLRELILKFVETQVFAIDKIRKENSDVFKRKIKEVQRTLENLMLKSEKSIDLLRKNIEIMFPERGELQSFSKNFDRHGEKLLKDGKIKISRTVKDIFSSIKDKASNIRYASSYAEINAAIKKIENDLNKSSIKDLQDQVNFSFSDAKERIEDSLEKYIEKLELDSQTKDDLRERSLEAVKDCRIFLGDISYAPPRYLIKHGERLFKNSS
jgi:predicted GTPase